MSQWCAPKTRPRPREHGKSVELKHSLRLARMARSELTPNEPIEGARPRRSASVDPPTVSFAPVRPPAHPADAVPAQPVSPAQTPTGGSEPRPAAPPAPAPSVDLAAPVDSPPAWFAAPTGDPDTHLPGSSGEHLLQRAYGTRQRAERFYSDQVLDHLNNEMIEFVGRMEMVFIATADGHGESDCSFRAGPPGFIRVLDRRQVAYPEYRGNGVLASLGNISENPHVGLMLIDFVRDQIGLHINGRARIVEDEDLREQFAGLPVESVRGRSPERWVVVDVVEAYIHCRKHIPRLRHVEAGDGRDWGTDDVRRKGGDYFGVRQARRDACAVEADVRPSERVQSSVNGS